MRDARRLDHPGAFQLNGISSDLVEQPRTCAEQTGLEALLRDTRRGDGDVLLPRGLLSLTNGAFDAVRDEGKTAHLHLEGARPIPVGRCG